MSKAIEGVDHSVKHRFETLRGQGLGKGRVRVRPGDDQHRHQAPTFGEIDVDVAEVGFEAPCKPGLYRKSPAARAATCTVREDGPAR